MNEINIPNSHSDHSINKKNLKTYCKDVLNYNGYNSYSISLIFVDQDELREMKNEYFKKNVYTDIIAFNLNDDNEELDGELYLSFETIKNNATLYNESSENEIKRVVAHGLLHLIGYKDDNGARKKEMTKIEDHCIKLFKHITLIC